MIHLTSFVVWVWFAIFHQCSSAGVTRQHRFEDKDYEYYFSDNDARWDLANESCVNMGLGYLASISSVEENNFIVTTLQDNPHNTVAPIWIGLHRLSGDCNSCKDVHTNNSYCEALTNECCDCRSMWSWTDGSDMTFWNWMYSEPSGGDGNECGRIASAERGHPVETGLFWFDFNCNDNARFLCKKTISEGTSPGNSGTTANNTDGPKQEKNKNTDNSATIIGVSSGIVIVLLAVVAVVLIIFIKRKRQQKKRDNHNTEDHVYYNEGKSYPTYENYSQDTNNDNKTDDIPPSETTGTTYAEVILPTAKPKPLKPKPVQDKVIQYAEIDLSPSGTQPNNGFQGEYSSVDSLNRVRTLSYESGYAGMEDDTGNTADTAQNRNALTPKPQLTEEELQGMYAQPMKKNKGDKSPQVLHRPAPNDTGVLYAVSMK